MLCLVRQRVHIKRQLHFCQLLGTVQLVEFTAVLDGPFRDNHSSSAAQVSSTHARVTKLQVSAQVACLL